MTNPMPENPDWISRRHRALHFTLYPINYPRIDADRLIEQLQEWRVSLFTFFAGGYTTAYPSALPWQPPSEHLPPGRDILGEILTAADRAGIVAIPVIDLGDLRLDIARQHPEWAMWEADGSIRLKSRDYAVSSPCGAYRHGNAGELVRELRERYGDLFKAIKWGGASYGFGGGVDHNPESVRRWREWSGRELPAATADPEYRRWRESVMAGLVERLTGIARSEGGVPTIGNSIWNLGQGQHFADLAAAQSLTQVEIQTRTYLIQDDDSEGGWERFSTPIETTRYVAGLTRHPPLVVASYFLAWPWRRVAVPPAEQFAYLAQVAANGGSPMVNMTAGTADQHEDARGFPAIGKLFNFLADHRDCFEAEGSAARLALVYDHASACAARHKGDLHRHYLREMHALQDALDRLHLPYDLLDSEKLAAVESDRYHALAIPAAPEISPAGVEQLERLQRAGAGLALIGATVTGPLARAFGFRFDPEPQPFTRHDMPGPCQAYVRVPETEHPLLAGLGRPWLAAAGHWYRAADLPAAAEVLLTRAHPLRLFPEGVAYTQEPDPAEPLAAALPAAKRAGAVLALAFDAGRCAARTGHPDNRALLANALRCAAGGRIGIRCASHPNLRLSLRRAESGLIVHLIATAGEGERYHSEIPALHDIRLEIDHPTRPTAVELRADGVACEWTWSDGRLAVTIPTLHDYGLLVIQP